MTRQPWIDETVDDYRPDPPAHLGVLVAGFVGLAAALIFGAAAWLVRGAG